MKQRLVDILFQSSIENEMFEVTTATHGFHMDKGKISKLLISKRTNVVVISGNHLASLFTCACCLCSCKD